MIKIFTRYAGMALIVASLSVTHAQAQQKTRCSTMEHELELQRKNPKRAQELADYEAQVQRFMQSPAAHKTAQTVYTIPVVVHVLYNTAAENISDAQVLSQIEVLNQDYGRTNADTTNTPSAFQPVASTTSIQFCMAQTDPNGAPTTGIERRNTSVTSWSSNDAIKAFSTGGLNAWDPSRYMNIWVGNLGGGLLGYAEFPTTSLSNTYGLVIIYSSFGNMGTVTAPYDLGRTATHELGHCFNLRHIWGDANCGNDFVNDTPTQQAANFGCPVFPHVTCTNGPNGDMSMNYMDYTDDLCMNTFTAGQAARMFPVINTPPYNSLITSNVCSPAVLVTDDAGIQSVISPSGNSCSGTVNGVVVLRNSGSNTLTSVNINYGIDANTPVVYNWTGSLATLDTITVNLPALTAVAGSHTYNVSTSLPNGVADNNPANDAASGSFTIINNGQALPYAEGFEGATFPPANATIVNDDGLTTWASTTDAAKTGTHSLYMDNYNYNASGQIDEFLLPNVNLTTANSPQLSFQLAYDLYTDPTTTPSFSDTLEVLLSSDCGVTYSSIYKKYGTALVTAGPPYFTTASFIPTANQWRRDSVDLSAYAPFSNVIVKFRNITNYENQLYIDDINIAGTTGITETLGGTNVSVYPNPVSDNLNLHLEGNHSGTITLELFDAQGRMVYNSTVKESESAVTIPMTRDAKGIYMLKLKNNAGSMTRRIVKQ